MEYGDLEGLTLELGHRRKEIHITGPNLPMPPDPARAIDIGSVIIHQKMCLRGLTCLVHRILKKGTIRFLSSGLR